MTITKLNKTAIHYKDGGMCLAEIWREDHKPGVRALSPLSLLMGLALVVCTTLQVNLVLVHEGVASTTVAPPQAMSCWWFITCSFNADTTKVDHLSVNYVLCPVYSIKVLLFRKLLEFWEGQMQSKTVLSANLSCFQETEHRWTPTLQWSDNKLILYWSWWVWS